MTPSEEREYLINLLFEGTRWKVDHDEVLNGLELEVRDRLRRLSGINTIDEDGLCQSHPENLTAEDEPLTGTDYQALDDYIEKKRAQNRKAKEKWKKDKVRVVMDGKPVWKSRAECHQEKRFPDQPDSTLFRWVWDGPVATDEK